VTTAVGGEAVTITVGGDAVTTAVGGDEPRRARKVPRELKYGAPHADPTAPAEDAEQQRSAQRATPRRVLLVSGSTRSAATSTALLRTAAECAPPGIEALLYPGMSELPHFVPDLDADDRLPARVDTLRAEIAASDAVLFCTPEYAGTLPGSLKNLLEWTVGSTVLTGKPVAWVNAAADPRRGGGAIANLETVLGYVQARLVREACRSVPVPRAAVDQYVLVDDPAARAEIADVLSRLLGH
jgi:NAD(P)H-dependent FMN reductase